MAFCEHINEPTSLIEIENFLYLLNTYELLKKESDPEVSFSVVTTLRL